MHIVSAKQAIYANYKVVLEHSRFESIHPVNFRLHEWLWISKPYCLRYSAHEQDLTNKNI